MEDIEGTARLAATRAGGVLRAHFRERPATTTKSSDVDLVTAADREAEAVVLGVLAAAFPTDGVLAEESGEHPGTSGRRWVVDPLDGTSNFAHGFPHFAVSIGLVDDRGTCFGLVYDPVREETFTAHRGGGARLNGAPIRVSAVARLADALLATGFGPDRRTAADRYAAYVAVALQRAHCLRRAGSAALDLSWVASARLDGYFELGLRPWDTAAGRLLVAEAGGVVTAFDGGSHRLEGGSIAASNGRVHAELVAMLREMDASPTIAR